MSADNIADWKNIHGVNSPLLNAYGIKSGRVGETIPNTRFSKEEYIRMIKFKRAFLTRIHRELSRRFPDTEIRVKFVKYLDYIDITIFDQPVHQNGKNIKSTYRYDFKIDSIENEKPNGKQNKAPQNP